MTWLLTFAGASSTLGAIVKGTEREVTVEAATPMEALRRARDLGEDGLLIGFEEQPARAG